MLVNGNPQHLFVHTAFLAEGQGSQFYSGGVIQDSTARLDSVSDDKVLAWLDGVYSLVYNGVSCVFEWDNLEVIIDGGSTDWVPSPDVCRFNTQVGPFVFPTEVVMEIKGKVDSS